MAEKKNTLSKRDLIISWFWYFCTCMSAVSAVRQNGTAYGAGMSVLADKLYGNDPKEKAAFLKRHLSYYITEHAFGSAVFGLVLSMEEERANGNTEISDEMIVGIKSSLMGPLAGFGDPLWQSCYRALLVAYTQPLAYQGSWAAAFLCWFGYVVPRWIVGYLFLFEGYKRGKTSVMNLLENKMVKQIVDACGVLGMFIMGSMSAAYVSVKTSAAWTVNETVVELQSVLDQSLPGLLPVGLVMLIYWLFAHKRVSPNIIMVGLIIAALAGALIGFF